MPYNPFARWRITGTWAAHMSYSAGGEDYPLPYGTVLPAPASGTLHTSGRPGSGFEFQCGQVGSAGRRSILMLDRPIRDVVAVVFQHQSAFGYERHYDEGATCGWSGASANGRDWGGDVHLHIHCLTASGQRRRFTDYFGSIASSGPSIPAGTGAHPIGGPTGSTNPIEEDDMFSDEDRKRMAGLEESVRNLAAVLIKIVTREGRGPGVARVYENADTNEVSIGVFGEFWFTLGPGVDPRPTIDLFAADGFVQDWADRKFYPTVRYEFARMLCGTPKSYDSQQIADLARKIDEIGAEELARIEAEGKAGDEPALAPATAE
ncbi:hypothetical protein [Rathayibacter sp. AY1E1]|uniref:hypothetical protein n=1 Tax=Rathayibacter sp. AY1E1 TaxID=2080549 RepID=UPI000CE92F38|nr:hypothetical protein [Rathayibacter sp. AY1E1]PPH51191.1 hypothetical protein C5C67_11785 [Rathayibacter sp. AY1E1]